MNDLDFEQRALANPYDDSPEFLAALQENVERQHFLEDLKKFEDQFRTSLHSVSASDELKQSLLDPLLLEQKVKTPSSSAEAANDKRFWTRLLPVAACLVLAIGMTITYLPSLQNGTTLTFEQEVFAHIYDEIDYLQVENNLSVAELNGIMANVVSSQLQQSPDLSALNIRMAMDCVFAQQDSIHMVLAGNEGAVTVFVIPNSPVSNEMSISDERFEGIISPTPGGNLVIIGEKQESILEFKNLLASNMAW
ncbi:DUF3379 domain-containing protein [Gammaproteobacteria bacterium]|nr:DUF3379 domain-containing protein [Gammaproteobacteria bacterium]